MPYVLVTTQIRLETGPCTIGDESSDTELMQFCGGRLVKQLGNNFLEWRTEQKPRIVLDRLEKRGYTVVSVTGVGQTCIWTCHKPLDTTKQDNQS